ELAEGVRNRREGDAPVDLIELPADEVAALLGNGLVDLVHQRRLPDAGVARDQQELGGARLGAIEGGEEDLDLRLPAIELLGNAERVRDVVCPQRERVDLPVLGPPREARLEVALEPAGGLVA